MDHDEGATWCHRVAGEIEWASVDPVICRDGRLVRVRSYHVERKFCLWYEFVPKVDGERRVRASEYSYEVAFERLYYLPVLLYWLVCYKGERTGIGFCWL